MNQLVFVDNNRVLTDSLTVAETFEKSHDKVLRDIRELNCSKEFSLANFGESTYANERGREYPRILMTQDGFTLLVMGYTGKKAMEFKEAYIKAFREMERQLIQPPKTQAELSLMMAQTLVDQEKRITTVEQQFNQTSAELKELKRGLINLDKPLRIQFKEAVMEYKAKSGVGSFKTAYDDVYKILNAQHHVNIQKRAANRNMKPVEIVEELNLLVPAIRIAKALIEKE